MEGDVLLAGKPAIFPGTKKVSGTLQQVNDPLPDNNPKVPDTFFVPRYFRNFLAFASSAQGPPLSLLRWRTTTSK